MNSQWERTKKGKGRSVPMTTLAREEFLAALNEAGDSEYVFVNKKTPKPLTDVKKAFATALCKAHIEDFHFHDLRPTCATRLGDRGASAFEIAKIMGWSDIRMAMRYTHATGDGFDEPCNCSHKPWGRRNTRQTRPRELDRRKSPHQYSKTGSHALPVNA